VRELRSCTFKVSTVVLTSQIQEGGMAVTTEIAPNIYRVSIFAAEVGEEIFDFDAMQTAA
jgi:hypothetical protein